MPDARHQLSQQEGFEGCLLALGRQPLIHVCSARQRCVSTGPRACTPKWSGSIGTASVPLIACLTYGPSQSPRLLSQARGIRGLDDPISVQGYWCGQLCSAVNSLSDFLKTARRYRGDMQPLSPLRSDISSMAFWTNIHLCPTTKAAPKDTCASTTVLQHIVKHGTLLPFGVALT